jgi:hypothetical protein
MTHLREETRPVRAIELNESTFEISGMGIVEPFYGPESIRCEAPDVVEEAV